MTTVSVIIPVYNVEKYVAQAVQSVLHQTYQDFEIIIVDDESPDRSIEICRSFKDDRIKIIQQKNRGLAGARNTGIRHSQGKYIALLDSDDVWLPQKLARQVNHLNDNPLIGVSFSPAGFMDSQDIFLHTYQNPQLTDITPFSLLCSNSIGSGSSPMIRKEVFEAIKYPDNRHGDTEYCYFDEDFRRSEDLECWLRIAIQTSWKIEGIAESLLYYRINPESLSSDLMTQYDSWEQVVNKMRTYAPDLTTEIESLARAFQLRYLARNAIRLRQGKMAVKLINLALKSDKKIFWNDPIRTFITIIASYSIKFMPLSFYGFLEKIVLFLKNLLPSKKYK